MKLNYPELLLIFYILLPVRNDLVAPILLSQIRAILTIRRAEKNLGLNLELTNDIDEVLREFLGSFWLNPGNTAAYAYLGLLSLIRAYSIIL